jgi:DNA-binding PadR family transcriptional regulator
MSSMNPPWDAGWPGRPGAGRPHRRHHRPGPGFGPAQAHMGPPPPEPPPGPEAEGPGFGRGRGGPEPGRRGRGRGFRGSFPGFGPGGPRGGFPGRGGRRGRRTSRGDVRSAVLALVAEQPRHGYEIIQEIGERTGGVWRPSPGSIYPTVAQLEDEGLVRTEKVDGRRVVHLTEEGTRYVEEHRADLDAVWEAAGRDADDDATALWEQLAQLHAAAHQVMSAGTPEQVTAAAAALAEARKTIYRLLAE